MIVCGRIALAGVGALALGVSLGGCAGAPAGPQPWAAATVVAASVDIPDDAAAIGLLKVAATSAEQTSFDGVALWSPPDGSTPLRLIVVHRPGQGTVTALESTTRAGLADGQFVPDAPAAGSPSAALPFLDLLIRRFGVVLAGSDTLMGRETDVVEARDERGDPQGRFWIDRGTGLMVKRQLIDTTSRQVRGMEFVSLHVPATAEAPAGAAVTATPGPRLDEVAVVRLRSEGWVCPEALPGGLAFVEAHEADDGGVQLVYSDGLEVVSLFVQRGRLDREAMPGMVVAPFAAGAVLRSASGAPTWVWQSSDSVLTVMTDAPESFVERIVGALPPDQS